MAYRYKCREQSRKYFTFTKHLTSVMTYSLSQELNCSIYYLLLFSKNAFDLCIQEALHKMETHERGKVPKICAKVKEAVQRDFEINWRNNYHELISVKVLDRWYRREWAYNSEIRGSLSREGINICMLQFPSRLKVPSINQFFFQIRPSSF